MSSKKFKTIDLFAGIGGIRKGFEETGHFETVFANDFDPYCKVTYDLNHDEPKLTIADITKIDPEKDLPRDFDILLGGFPCQAFSIAGYRHGFNDIKGRGNLFFDIARILKECQPKAFLLENVKNLQSHDNKKTFSIIKQVLEELGYHIKYAVLNSMEYGNVPQNRERIYIAGFKSKDHYEKFSFPLPIPLTKKASDLLEPEVPEKYYYTGKPLELKLKEFEEKQGISLKEGSIYQWRRVYIRENKKGVFPTLTANMGTGGHNVPIVKDRKGLRKLTPLECARIMGFYDIQIPTGLVDSRLYKQFGNSVVVPVIKRIAEKIATALKD